MALLFVDDDPTIRQVASFNLQKAGHDVDVSATGQEALRRFDPARHDLVITDLNMPGVDGLQVVAAVSARAPWVPVIVITAYGSVDKAVAAMKAGAWSFLEKPFSRARLDLTVSRALETSRLRRDNQMLRSVERPMVAASPEMVKVLQMCDRVAMAEAPVLVVGESGTGKELVARRIHGRSARGEGPFVAVNCAAIPAPLLEAELFGHSEGAFTGAARARQGRFRAAAGGTLFLDEIGEMPLEVQAKLLRVLQERQVDVVGSDQPVDVDVRVVAATNRDLHRMVAERSFREDLLYRLDVLRVDVPPLRQRLEDIEPLVTSFLDEISPRTLVFSAEAMDALRQRAWRGNVRELRNLCERVAILAPGPVIEASDLAPERLRAASSASWLDALPEGISLVDIEAQVIQHFLHRNRWNVSKTARQLGVPRHILAYRIEKYGLDEPGSA
jgi:DNA-binding NtrC family response regulator